MPPFAVRGFFRKEKAAGFFCDSGGEISPKFAKLVDFSTKGQDNRATGIGVIR